VLNEAIAADMYQDLDEKLQRLRMPAAKHLCATKTLERGVTLLWMATFLRRVNLKSC